MASRECLNPLIAFMKKDHITGKNKLSGFFNLKKTVEETGNDRYLLLFKHQFYSSLLEIFLNDSRGEPILLPCRKCVNCQLNRAQEWAIRNTLESREYDPDSCLFITLTYDDDAVKSYQRHIIDYKGRIYEWYSLWKPDLQAFVKKLRDIFKGRRIRYYGCGEYGSHTLRPHYHLLLYGLSLQDLATIVYKNKTYAVVKKRDTKDGSFYYSELLEDEVWQKGFVDISLFSPFTASYVSRYCTKKVSDQKRIDGFIFFNGLQTEFNCMSLKPAIAKNYAIKNLSEIYKDDEFLYHFNSKTLVLKPIKYWDRLYDIESPDNMAFIKENRKEFAKLNSYLERLETNLNISEYLRNIEEVENKKLRERSKV